MGGEPLLGLMQVIGHTPHEVIHEPGAVVIEGGSVRVVEG